MVIDEDMNEQTHNLLAWWCIQGLFYRCKENLVIVSVIVSVIMNVYMNKRLTTVHFSNSFVQVVEVTCDMLNLDLFSMCIWFVNFDMWMCESGVWL